MPKISSVFKIGTKIIFAALILLCIFSYFTVLSHASSYDISEEYSQMLSSIPDELSDCLPGELFTDDANSLYKAGEKLTDFSYIVRTVGSLCGVSFGSALGLFATLLGIVVVSALLRTLRGLSSSPNLDTAISLSTTAVLMSAIIAVQYDRLCDVVTYLGRLNIFADSMLPLMGSLYAMGGNVATAAVNNSAMMIFLVVCENLCNKTVIPVTVICLSLTLASVFSPSIDMKGVSAFIKKCFTFIIGFVMTLLLTILSAQSTLSAAGDSIAAKSAKFIAGSMIPVVGGAVGESLKTVAGSISYIRASVGVVGVMVILLMLLPTLIGVILTRLAFMASGTAARMLGCSDEASLLGEMTNIYGYLIAVMCASSVMFIFALTLMAHTTSAIGV